MALQLSTDARAFRMTTIETTIGTSPKLRLLTGSQPANCAAAQTGSLLAELTLPSDWWLPNVGGFGTLQTTVTGTATGAGTVGHFRLLDSAGTTCHIQGSAGTSGTDMILDSASFSIGQAFTLLSFSITSGNA